MRTKRSTFRRRQTPVNTAYFARKSWNENLAHYSYLHHPKRERSASELDTMRLAARRRPHGFAAAYLTAINLPPPAEPKKRATRAKKAAA